MKNNIVVVFSSHLSEDENNKFIKHIGDTIGCKHKVVCYPNFNQYSLPEVYNKAIAEHNNPDAIMVFCHNDIFIKTVSKRNINCIKKEQFKFISFYKELASRQ